MKTLLLILLVALAPFAFASERPNIVLVMCDDMGFSDLGCYGGEVRTPNLDALAREGIRFTQFKNTGRCCPSRASLMTGRYSHAVGMGWMTAVDEHRPGYRGQLTDKVPTIAEILRAEGYGTYLCGKWHLTVDGNYRGKTAPVPNGSWPVERGFDQSYGGLSGGGGYYRVNSLVRNTTKINEFPEDYYYTDAITKNAVRFITHHDRTKPLFLYIAHYAPHRPLEAPKQRVDACRARYKEGYDQLRQRRFDKLQQLGLMDSQRKLPIHEREYRNNRPAWDALSNKQQKRWITEMATYAAMIEIMDDGIGEVVATLKQQGMYDNTILLFLSDNGASAEGGLISQLAADLSNTPYREYKKSNFEGGISSPLIVRLPKLSQQHQGTLRRDPAHITDVLPTCLELADVDYPTAFAGESIPQPDGVSLAPVLAGEPLCDRLCFFEHGCNRAVIDGEWKLVKSHHQQAWELIHLAKDPFELLDVSSQHANTVKRLETAWTSWAQDNYVLPIEPGNWNARVEKYKAKNPDQDGVD